MSGTQEPAAAELRIGMIGLDTSHCEAFVRLLNQPDHPEHIPGGRVCLAYPGGSADLEESRSRVERITEALRDNWSVGIAASPEEVAARTDAILLTSVDGRVHLQQFRKIAPYGKPVFVDKPFAIDTAAAGEMAELSQRYKFPLMSASSLRFDESLMAALAADHGSPVTGADCSGPMKMIAQNPGLFWYGIHSVETLYSVMGQGCTQVTAAPTEQYDLVVGHWKDGRIGTVRGNRSGTGRFGALIHREKSSQHIVQQTSSAYVGLIRAVMRMFGTGETAVDLAETLEIIRFIEAANESRTTGLTVEL
jgi:predicted dehydrogenase